VALTAADKRARALLLAGASLSAVGVVVAATASQAVGGPVAVAGWALFVYAVHAFGRLGTAPSP
jgi:hypothetical protein